MRTLMVLLITFTIVIAPLLTTSGSAPDDVPLSEPVPSEAAQESADARDLLAMTPTAFTENRGQVGDHVCFYVQGGGLWFTGDGVWFDIREEAEADARPDPFDPFEPNVDPGPKRCRGVILKQEFVGCNEVEPEGAEYAGWNSNFFYGNDPEGWRTDVPNWREVWYRDLWDGIDLRYYTNEDGLKYDLIIHPGGEIEQIGITYPGSNGIGTKGPASIVIGTEAGDLLEDGLFMYQPTNGQRHAIAGEFNIGRGDQISFSPLDVYDTLLPLVIDPYIEYSTFLGGSAEDEAYDVEMDTNCNPILTGYTRSNDFPTTPGAYQTDFSGGGEDVYITKLDLTGSSVLFSTYIGGNGSEWGRSIAVDTKDYMYLTGSTTSQAFPMTQATYDDTFNGDHDLFVLKLNPSGSSLMYSSYIGSDDVDIGRSLSVGPSGTVYITGNTLSEGFPVTDGALDTTYGGGGKNGDAFALHLDMVQSTMLFATYIGGNGSDMAKDMAVDDYGNLFVSGHTTSADFPTTPGAFDTSYSTNDAHSTSDGFVLKLAPSGSSLLYSTFVGGSGDEVGGDIFIDAAGDAFVTGTTTSLDFPTTPGAYDTEYLDNTSEAFAFKLDPSGSALLYSTYLGGSDDEWGRDIAVDCAGKAIIIGETASSDFPVSKDALNATFNGGDLDSFVLKLNTRGSSVVYSTYLGGKNNDHGRDVTIDHDGNTLIVGSTQSAKFPVTEGAYDVKFNGGVKDVFCLKFMFGIMNITSISLLRDGGPIEKIYARYDTYRLRVELMNTASLSDVRFLRLSLDPGGMDIQLCWYPGTSEITKQNDPFGYISLGSTSRAYNDSKERWTIDFDMVFNWHYPNENLQDVLAYANAIILPPTWRNFTDFYSVENDLLFTGELEVKGEAERELYDLDFVRGGEVLEWSGLTPVYEGTTDTYPPDKEFNITIWDEREDPWCFSPMPGECLCYETSAPDASDTDGDLHRINISVIPPECDATNRTFTVLVDGDNVSYLSPFPSCDEWQTSDNVGVGVTIEDTGGSGVDGGTVQVRLSTDNGLGWHDWVADPCLSAMNITTDFQTHFGQGTDNLVQWRACDVVGNGPTESPPYRVMVDTEEVYFSDFEYSLMARRGKTKASANITITDATSGVDGKRIQYSISNGPAAEWGDWRDAGEAADDDQLNVSIREGFVDGAENRIKWRAWDVAGNGPTESPVCFVNLTAEPPPTMPRVFLSSPPNGQVLDSTQVELAWRPEQDDFKDVRYVVYLDTVSPPKVTLSIEHDDLTVSAPDLMDGVTYYWTVLPLSNEFGIGECLDGVWEFTVDLGEEPVHFGVELEPVEDVSLKPGESLRIASKASNSGSAKDRFELSLNAPGLEDQISIEGENPLIVGYDGEAGFFIKIQILKETTTGDFPVTIMASSLGASDLGQYVTKNETFIVHVFDDPGTSDIPINPANESGNVESKIITTTILVFILILLTMVILVTYIVRRRKSKRSVGVEGEKSNAGDSSIRPNIDTSMISTPMVATVPKVMAIPIQGTQYPSVPVTPHPSPMANPPVAKVLTTPTPVNPQILMQLGAGNRGIAPPPLATPVVGRTTAVEIVGAREETPMLPPQERPEPSS